MLAQPNRNEQPQRAATSFKQFLLPRVVEFGDLGTFLGLKAIEIRHPLEVLEQYLGLRYMK